MDKLIDFTDCKRAHKAFGGTDRKFGVIYDNDVYMLKFPENHAKKSDISTSYVNNVVSEYISSHIANSIGIPTHETVLGTYHDEIVVGCKDFRSSDIAANIEFSEYVRARYDSKDVKRMVLLEQIYDTLSDPDNAIPEDLQKSTIERYWDTFVIDALVGNFDRHIGNWGYISENNKLSLAPVYDFGSTLFPQISDIGAYEYLNDEFKILERTLVFPSPVLAVTSEKVGKVGYYDMLSSDFDANCTEAVLRIAPKISLDSIKGIIDNTPVITDVRKDFYKKILTSRKELIIDRAYLRCVYKEFDKDALKRITEGKQYNIKDLENFIEERKNAAKKIEEIEEKLRILNTKEYILSHNKTYNEKTLLDQQRELCEKYGFYSLAVQNKVKSKFKNMNQDSQLPGNELPGL